MTDSPLHLAHRELQRLLPNPKVWIGVVSVGIVAGLSGPFGTIDYLTTLPRLLYWCGLSVTSFFVGAWVGTFMHVWLRSYLAELAAILCAGLHVGLALTVLLSAINLVVFGISPLNPDHLLGTVINVGLISLVVTFAFVAFDHLDAAKADTKETAESLAAEALMRRLPFEKRGPLLSLSATDHYVDVATEAGNELLLMRLTDAIDLTAGTKGLRVHRSHWVARTAIVGVRRENGRLFLSLTDGRDIPVSRTYVSAVKEAGIIPE